MDSIDLTSTQRPSTSTPLTEPPSWFFAESDEPLALTAYLVATYHSHIDAECRGGWGALIADARAPASAAQPSSNLAETWELNGRLRAKSSYDTAIVAMTRLFEAITEAIRQRALILTKPPKLWSMVVFAPTTQFVDVEEKWLGRWIAEDFYVHDGYSGRQIKHEQEWRTYVEAKYALQRLAHVSIRFERPPKHIKDNKLARHRLNHAKALAQAALSE